MTHCTPLRLRSSSCWMFGLAMATMVWSMKVMATAKSIAVSARPLLRAVVYRAVFGPPGAGGPKDSAVTLPPGKELPTLAADLASSAARRDDHTRRFTAMPWRAGTAPELTTGSPWRYWAHDVARAPIDTEQKGGPSPAGGDCGDARRARGLHRRAAHDNSRTRAAVGRVHRRRAGPGRGEGR